jgi:sensor domain CHASE-containing protein
MKIKSGYILRQVAGEYVVVPTGEDLNLNMMITLNETGAFLWKLMEQDTDEKAMVAALLEEYDVDEAAARAHVDTFVKKLKEQDFLA